MCVCESCLVHGRMQMQMQGSRLATSAYLTMLRLDVGVLCLTLA